MHNPNVLFGKRLRELPEKLGVSQERLAEAAGVHPTFMVRVERGKQKIRFDDIIRIARALRVQPQELVSKIK